MNFDELAVQRKAVQLFCDRHVSSIQAFRSGQSYKLKDDEDDLGDGLHHLTSTATCIESLLGCPTKFLPPDFKPAEAAAIFATAAIERPFEDWKSEESATIYCRCRGLPLTIRFLTGEYTPLIEQHIDRILAQLDKDPRFAIGEADLNTSRDAWYPPNAFHTYWTLDVLERFKCKYKGQYDAYAAARSLEHKRSGMLHWVRRQLGYQIALHGAHSSVLDTDQLAWSLATVLRFEPNFPSDLGEQDLLRETLKWLFHSQLEVGTWRHYRSLFHYRAAGNAYCYVYETFAALIRIAVDGTYRRKFFRDALCPYQENLHRLWDYANSTKSYLTEVPHDLSAVGWCSGHRLNQTRPESWATASVFAFAQAYRRLLGFWTREAAVKDLNVVSPRFDLAPTEVLQHRGNTWVTPGSPTTTVTDQLFSMFVNPVLLRGSMLSEEDPDAEILNKNQGRSAILFGPPGASKTTLVQAVAQCIGWQYIEIHANHFVADGLQQIHRKADEIFRRLMQLDHTVVLFDEIDELVREREGGPDAFGRFLTTSMLPKLTELWKQRRIMYFVATNHIKYFDRAITRSERFDAAILVGQPSVAAKTKRLATILKALDVTATFDDLGEKIWSALQQAGHDDRKDVEALSHEKLEDAHCLAKLVLLRWDQLDELAYHVHELMQGHPGALQIGEKLLCDALKLIGDRGLSVRSPYVEFLADVGYPRRDYDKYQVWSVAGVDKDTVTLPFVVENGSVWLRLDRDQHPPHELQGYALEKVESGTAYFKAKM